MNWPPIINMVVAMVLAALLPKAEHPIAILLGWVGIGCAIFVSYMLGYIDAMKGEKNGT